MPRISGLDELRGIAILLVMLAHFIGVRAGSAHDVLGEERSLTDQSLIAIGFWTPGDRSAATGVVDMEGWAADRGSTEGTGVSGVEIFVDGQYVGEAEYGRPAPDVVTSFGSERYLNSGWLYRWDTATAKPGIRVVEARARLTGAAAGDPAVSSFVGSGLISLNVSQLDQPARAGVVFAGLYEPDDQVTFTGIRHIHGWAIDSTPNAPGTGVSGVDVYLDGVFLGAAHYGLTQPDVSNSFKNQKYRDSGWIFELDTSRIEIGHHVITVKVRPSLPSPGDAPEGISPAVGDSIRDFFSNRQRVKEPSMFKGTVGLSIESPSDSTVVTGRVRMFGWAIDLADDPDAGVRRIDIELDGEYIGTATYGLPRSDVAESFGERHAYSGWEFDWDTATVPQGRHALTIRLHTNSKPISTPWVHHLGVTWVPQWYWGAMGVDLFFVISGFLITTILVTTKGGPGYFRIFYARRALRILPLAWVVIAFSYAIFPEAREYVYYHLLFINNYAPGQMLGLGPMWSLAIEEQFYLVFPLLCFWTPKRWLFVPVAILFVVFFSFHMASPRSGLDLYYSSYDYRTHARAYMLVAGTWLALVRLGLVPRPHLFLIGLAGFVFVSVAIFGGYVGQLEYLVYPLQVLLVYLAVTGKWVLRNPVLKFLGVRCYSLYLFHVFVLIYMERNVPSFPLVIDFLLFVGVTTLFAHLSFEYFELPLVRRGPRQIRMTTPAPTVIAQPRTVGSLASNGARPHDDSLKSGASHVPTSNGTVVVYAEGAVTAVRPGSTPPEIDVQSGDHIVTLVVRDPDLTIESVSLGVQLRFEGSSIAANGTREA